MKWAYTRIRSAGCSKWRLGNSWVTRFDDSVYCDVGVLGEHFGTFDASPQEARRMVEQELVRRKGGDGG